MSPTGMATNTPSIAPSSAPPVVEIEEGAPDEDSSNNIGILVGSAVGGVVVLGILILAAYEYGKRRNAPVPPTTGVAADLPAVPPSDTRPSTIEVQAPSVASVVPFAVAAPMTEADVLYKDQCRSVAEPHTAPIVARLAKPAVDGSSDSQLPLATAVAESLSARRPLLDP